MPAKTSKTQAKPIVKKPVVRGGAKKAASGSERAKRRFWLTYPRKEITKPVIWEMSQRFRVVFNVRQASVTEEIGILCLELEAEPKELRAAIAWLEKQGVKVEPVEINVIDG
ncbi:MAG: NIL domain-containing protein [Verrucomicrobiales bacterium]|nr:NIL domain-containing protein [Verrucomicrobiales bacterium]